MAKMFKTRAELLGGHYHVQVFVAPGPDRTFAGIGTLVMSEDDYDGFINRFNAMHTTKISPTSTAETIPDHEFTPRLEGKEMRQP